MEKDFTPVLYKKEDESKLIDFLAECLPESGRILDINGRHSFYKNIENSFDRFWCMLRESSIVGTVAVRKLDDKNCELKSLYLLEKYHGMGYGWHLLEIAIEYAKENGYEKMYLDSLSTSKRAVKLYQKAGFKDTERYNKNEHSDVFMVLDLH